MKDKDVKKFLDNFITSEQFMEFVHDDITWCGNECYYTECERNLANRLTKGGYYSAAWFKDTDMCPLTKKDGEQDAKEET